MQRQTSYNTKQKKAVLDYVASLEGIHVTAAQIVKHLESINSSVGRTTVYRNLERLTDDGSLHKYMVDGVSGACYQYVGSGGNSREPFHLKCEDCGELFHLDCEMLSNISRHMQKKHAFQINSMKTVLYGKCERCAKGQL